MNVMCPLGKTLNANVPCCSVAISVSRVSPTGSMSSYQDKTLPDTYGMFRKSNILQSKQRKTFFVNRGVAQVCESGRGTDVVYMM